MTFFILQIFTNVSNEVAAAYATGALGAIFGIFQYWVKERERKKNQVNAIELEKFKQKSELFMMLKKAQIGYNDELLNEVYRIRVELEKTIQVSEFANYQFLSACLEDFISYYRRNANKINYLDGSVRSFAHDILKYANVLESTVSLAGRRDLEAPDMEHMFGIVVKLLELITEYEDFLRQVSIKEFKRLDTN
ncbi:hypothetical protein [Pedobacter sp. MC2016-24]|uniref:hypothetical protein n=1 Tax=Pedobacter sp. MC2016-24 TaxID=2780090 RepID=UPI00187E2B93|nr:hypothetical protein [Pedobacter sp. MC2016-24]MBE9599974.1 hypothetical protein [Pedobacter sp. MC2016-24]